jgi:signal transduction histidine kinase
MRVKADEKRLAFVFDAGAGLPEAVLADERRLRQVLLNLLGNAIKFTDNGTVTLRACAEPQGPAQVLLRLDVEDTGVGMRPDEMERIFEPFEQVDDVQRRSGGTGLGLAITRALVNDMGGQVQVSSEWVAAPGSAWSCRRWRSRESARRKVPGVARYCTPWRVRWSTT